MGIFLNSEAHGLGDICVASFLPGITHYVTSKTKVGLVKLLGQPFTTKRPATMVDLHSIHQWERDNPDVPRLQARARAWGITGPVCRPAVDLAGSTGLNAVCLFPGCLEPARVWQGFPQLERLLRQCGVPVLTVTEGVGFSIRQLAALIRHSPLTVGNDSFPVNLAGVLDVPAICVMAGLPVNIYQHVPSVHCIAGNSLDQIAVEEVLRHIKKKTPHVAG